MKKIIFLISFSIALTNCGQPSALLPSVSSSSSVDCSNDGCFSAAAKRVQGVITQRQVLPNYMKCLNLPIANVSEATKTTMNESVASLSLEGDVKDISAPLLMAITKVAGEICNDLIKYEKPNLTNRKFFPGYKLGTSNSQTYSFSNTLKTFASACWGRAATDDEVAGVIASYKTATQDTSEAIYACTVMLSSSQAIKF
jgi:hypothetical protein